MLKVSGVKAFEQTVGKSFQNALPVGLQKLPG